jgi:hypothetical protein
MKRFISLLLIIALCLSVGACTTRPEEPVETPDETPEETAEPTAEPTPEATPTPTPEEPEETEPLYRDFFDGEGLDEQDYTRPFAVMINNINVAQPQCGIGDADIIYEVLAEGGITRMMAIFSHVKDAGVIGSMRSIRTYYVDIAMAYQAVAVHAGYSQQAISRIRSNGVDNICGVTGSYASETFYRDTSRMSYGIEHSLFTTGEKLYNCADKLGYALTVDEDYSNGLSFVKDGTPEDGEAANSINVSFSGYKTTKLTYHDDTELYTAVQHGGDYIDGDTGDNVTFTNVLVLSAATKTIDDYGRLDVTLTGTGTGYFACGGKYVEIIWSRDSLNDPFTYTLTDGTPLDIGVGKTYIAIIATNGGEVEFA